MERWWNIQIEVLIPYDTREEAIRALDGIDLNEVCDLAHRLFDGCHEAVIGRVIEATDE